MKRWLILTAASALCVLVAGEVGLRVVIGDRPLFRPHPTIEYENAPNQSLRYSGALIETNLLGLRSPELAATKPTDAMRVAVFGDSIVFGHLNIGQTDLATTLLAQERAPDGRRIETLNIAANSWGPGNMLAWLEAHGDMGADAAIIVLSTHDLADDRTFAPLSARHQPTGQMPLALLDLIVRNVAPPTPINGPRFYSIAGDARESIPPLFAKLKDRWGGACLIIHEDIAERAQAAPSSAVAELKAFADYRWLSVALTRDYVQTSSFIDNIHLNAQGQRELAEAMRACTRPLHTVR